MAFPRRHHFRRRDQGRERHFERPPVQQQEVYELMQPGHTGSEAEYLKSLVDSRAKVTVVLKTGERFQGRIRYYDKYCFSIGLSGQGPRFFIRKDSVSYIAEE